MILFRTLFHVMEMMRFLMVLLSFVYAQLDDYDCMLNQTNIGDNNNKYYVIQLVTANSKYHVFTRWGRVVSNLNIIMLLYTYMLPERLLFNLCGQDNSDSHISEGHSSEVNRAIIIIIKYIYTAPNTTFLGALGKAIFPVPK